MANTTLKLGIVYLDREEFLEALRSRPLPYTLAEVQHHIESCVQEGYDPRTLFDEVYRHFDLREWRAIVNRTMLEALKETASGS